MNPDKTKIEPLETLYDASRGTELPLPRDLAEFYGALRFPFPGDRPYVAANFVTSLDGVVSLGIPGKAGGGEISGFNKQDAALMGLLRAAADAVVEGAGTLRQGDGDPLTPANICPPLADAYKALRSALGKKGEPLAVIVTASGDLDPSLPIFKSEQPVLVVTSHEGLTTADRSGLGDVAQVVAVETQGDAIPARAVLKAVRSARDCDLVLVEGGPHLLGDFLADGLINEQFLTLSPQVVGRDDKEEHKRLALVEGHTFAPDHPLWSNLSVVKRGESHLFLRYLLSR
jgi:riboflavin biosynthesis pyrimidine reductase